MVVWYWGGENGWNAKFRGVHLRDYTRSGSLCANDLRHAEGKPQRTDYSARARAHTLRRKYIAWKHWCWPPSAPQITRRFHLLRACVWLPQRAWFIREDYMEILSFASPHLRLQDSIWSADDMKAPDSQRQCFQLFDDKHQRILPTFLPTGAQPCHSNSIKSRLWNLKPDPQTLHYTYIELRV